VEETTKRLLFVDHFVSGCRCGFDFPELRKRAEAGRLHIAGAAAGDSQKGKGGGGKCGDDTNHDGIYDGAEFRRWEAEFDKYGMRLRRSKIGLHIHRLGRGIAGATSPGEHDSRNGDENEFHEFLR
jgi:hypothetical protein